MEVRESEDRVRTEVTEREDRGKGEDEGEREWG